MHRKLLCIGREPMLLDTRVRVLSRLYPVQAAEGLSDLMSGDLRGQEWDVIVFCHSLSQEELQALRVFARERWPQAGLIAMYDSQSKFNPKDFDASVEGIQGPAALLQAVERLLRRRGPETDSRARSSVAGSPMESEQ